MDSSAVASTLHLQITALYSDTLRVVVVGRVRGESLLQNDTEFRDMTMQFHQGIMLEGYRCIGYEK